MPENTEPTAEQIAENNAKVKLQLEAQNRETATPDSKGLQDSNSALDDLAKEIVEKKQDPAPKEKKEDEAPPAPAPDPKEAEAAARAAAEKEALEKKSQDLFKDSPSLPAGASPKSSEAFASVKLRAAQEIAARDKELEEIRTKVKEMEAKLQSGPDPELIKELEDHRNWRAKLDVEADPSFKKFDQEVARNSEFIYAQLAKSAVISKETIDLIKKHGGPDRVKWDKIFTLLNDPTTQRIIESKIADIEVAKFSKEEAIKAAKENIGQYQAERQKAIEQSFSTHNEVTAKELKSLTDKLPWFAEKTADAKADEAAKKDVEAHNAFLKETKAHLETALKDDSAQMRAIMLTGMAQLLYTQRVRETEKATSTARISTLEKELAAANAKIEKFNNASGGATRIKESAAPQGGGRVEQKSKDGLDLTPATQALDDLARKVMDERARKGA
jgi:hypothetical protein